MSKVEATTKKTEAKEEGKTSSVNYKDIQQNRRYKIAIIVVSAVIVLAGVAALFFTFINQSVPRFMLVDLSLDPISNSKVLVKLSSTNPRCNGTFQIRDGVRNGDVIADVKIRKKRWIFTSTSSLLVTCPVLLNLKDLTAAAPAPMSKCQAQAI